MSLKTVTTPLATTLAALLPALVMGALPLTMSALGTGCGSEESTTGRAEADTGINTDVLRPVVDTAPAPVDTVEVPDTAPAQDTWTPPEPGEFGYGCDAHEDCNSGWCIQTAEGRQCTKSCVSECPSDYDCREAPGTDAIFICVPRFIHLCDPCDETADCNEAGQSGNFCLSYGADGKFCGAQCGEDDDCPGSSVCRDVPVGGGGTAMQCVPAEGAECSCSPLAKSLQLATTCFWENDNGKCEGQRFCTQNGLNSCDAQQPFPESCNGVDDNCNEAVDEFSPDYICQIENEFGSCPGAGSCTEGVETCIGDAPTPESCNLIDDDCDGETDEDICNDQNPCTIDFCNDDGECDHLDDDTQLCDDGSVCTQVDKCSAGQCIGYNPLACGDGNPCFDWFCDPVAGCLSSYANGDTCEDGEPCTADDSCNQGVCVAGSPTDCDDGNPCTIDSCTPGVGCTHNNAPNNSSCGGAGECTTGLCSNGQCMGTPIREGLSCTMGGLGQCERPVCNAGTCSAAPKQNGSSCAMANSKCSQGHCSGTTCFYTANTPCSTEMASDSFGICKEDVLGTCTADGSCIVSQSEMPSASCDDVSVLSFFLQVLLGPCEGGCLSVCGVVVCANWFSVLFGG